METTGKGTVGVASNKIQQRRNLEGSEIGYKVNSDNTTDAEKRGECFAPSVEKNILDKSPGFGKVKKGEYDAQGNRGLDQFKHDSRKTPLPEDGVKLNIHGRRRDEHAIGRSSTDVNDDNTVFGEDRFEGGENRDTTKGKKQGFQVKQKNIK